MAILFQALLTVALALRHTSGLQTGNSHNLPHKTMYNMPITVFVILEASLQQVLKSFVKHSHLIQDQSTSLIGYVSNAVSAMPTMNC